MKVSYGEVIKPYLIVTLQSVGAIVDDGKLIKTAEAAWEKPQVFVEMLPDTQDSDYWTTCHAKLRATLECADADVALERADSVLATIAQRILFYTEYGLPSISGVKPVWLPGATVRGSRLPKEALDPHNIELTWECDFPTACGGR